MITGLTHPGISVSNLENWLAFIRNNLDANHISSQVSDQDYLEKVTGFAGAKLKIGFVRFGGHSFPLEVIEYMNPKGKAQAIDYGNIGYAQLTFRVSNINTFHQENVQNGLRTGEIFESTHLYWGKYRGYHLTAPDNFPLNILEFPNSRDEMENAIHIHHSGLTVSNLEDAIDLLCNRLDLKMVQREKENQDPFWPALDTAYEYAILKIPAHDFWIELRQFDKAKSTHYDMAHNNFGSMHHCFQVDDIFKDYTVLEKAGVNFVGAPAQVTAGINKGAYAIYFYGFDGYRFEIFQKP